jgi:hypothetical protein
MSTERSETRTFLYMLGALAVLKLLWEIYLVFVPEGT